MFTFVKEKQKMTTTNTAKIFQYGSQPITALHLCLRLELIPCTVLGAAIIRKAINGPAVPLLKEISTQAADNYALMAGIVGEGLLRDIVQFVSKHSLLTK